MQKLLEVEENKFRLRAIYLSIDINSNFRQILIVIRVEYFKKDLDLVSAALNSGDRQRQVLSHVGSDRTMDQSVGLEPRIHIDRRNRSPAQGVTKTNKHYSYRERLSLSYSSHELVNTMKREREREALARALARLKKVH